MEHDLITANFRPHDGHGIRASPPRPMAEASSAWWPERGQWKKKGEPIKESHLAKNDDLQGVRVLDWQVGE
jgi:hypothetical protein